VYDKLNAVLDVNTLSTKLFVIDECHNFFNTVASNISSARGNTKMVYDTILYNISRSKRNKVLCLSGTPIINRPFELALCFNLCRPGLFPNNETDFNHYYIQNTQLKAEAKNSFMRRIQGLVSFYLGNMEGAYAKQTIKMIELKMPNFMKEVYDNFKAIETEIEKKSVKVGRNYKGSTIYKAYTRQACNFIFPYINSEINGITRPRPRKLEDIQDAYEIDKVNPKSLIASVYNKQLSKHIEMTIRHFKELYNKEKDRFSDDIKNFSNDASKFKTILCQKLYECSPKFFIICIKLLNEPGSHMIYSNYVRAEGIEMLKVYLDLFGINNYVEFTGDMKKEDKEKSLKKYNDKANLNGKIIKVVLISPSGKEGISLHNTKVVHILEPHWNMTATNQVIGRSIRYCGHSDLPLKDRNVIIYRYLMKIEGNISSDEWVYHIANTKFKLMDDFLKCLQNGAIDCYLFKDHHTDIVDDLECFRYNNESYFPVKKMIYGSGYNDNIEQDLLKYNSSGQHSLFSKKKEINVYSIYAKYISDREASKYWLDPGTNIVYDYNNKLPVGKILLNNSNVPTIENDIFILDVNSKIFIPNVRKS